VAVEVDHGSTSAKQAPGGRVWFVRIRRGNKAVIVNTGMSRVSAEHLAAEISCILSNHDPALIGGFSTMAREVVITDDLDGSPNAKTITYTFEGQEYEIDLSEENIEKLREALKPYLDKSRPVEREPVLELVPTGSRSRRRSSGTRASSGRSDLAEIRTWAQGEGLPVAERGRIKQEIISKYDEAHK
jgi:hypothetical protein